MFLVYSDFAKIGLLFLIFLSLLCYISFLGLRESVLRKVLITVTGLKLIKSVMKFLLYKDLNSICMI